MPSEYCNFGEERRPYSDSGEFLEMYTLDVILKSQSQEAFDRSLIHGALHVQLHYLALLRVVRDSMPWTPFDDR
jgi:hypothetical protein